MACYITTFKLRFPEFDSVAEPRMQIFLDDAVAELNEPAWGARYDIGICYLAAHWLALAIATESGNTGGLSPITSASADGLSTGFGKVQYSSSTQSYWESTSYGREFMRLKRTIFPGAFVATGA